LTSYRLILLASSLPWAVKDGCPHRQRFIPSDSLGGKTWLSLAFRIRKAKWRLGEAFILENFSERRDKIERTPCGVLFLSWVLLKRAIIFGDHLQRPGKRNGLDGFPPAFHLEKSLR
jgi:hypothetical protein